MNRPSQSGPRFGERVSAKHAIMRITGVEGPTFFHRDDDVSTIPALVIHDLDPLIGAEPVKASHADTRLRRL